MNKIDVDIIDKMLYSEQILPEIHPKIELSNEVECESLPTERCQEGVGISAIEVDKTKSSDSKSEAIDWGNIPNSLCAAEAEVWDSNEVDFRPHLYDAGLDQFMLVDSGSQCSAWPPDPGDQVDPSVQLKAVNNTKMKCYGFKDVVIKIGRKTYKFRAIKSEVDSRLLC